MGTLQHGNQDVLEIATGLGFNVLNEVPLKPECSVAVRRYVETPVKPSSKVLKLSQKQPLVGLPDDLAFLHKCWIWAAKLMSFSLFEKKVFDSYIRTISLKICTLCISI